MIFIKPNGKTKQYGDLKPISAIEPPVWLLTLASHYGADILDAEATELEHDQIANCIRSKEPVVILPTGSNSFGFFQQRQAAQELKEYLFENDILDVEIWDKMPIDPTEVKIDWDLLPMNLYRTPNWFAWGREDNKYGATFTSISCPYHCKFCHIHEFHTCKYKKRSPKSAVNDIVRLYIRYGITNFKLMDEIFVYNEEHVRDFCKHLLETDLNEKFNIWAYARIDTVNEKLLKHMKSSGIRWVSYGIESGVEEIRQTCGKGKFSNQKIKDIVKMTHDLGINIVGNYIFGFKEDNINTMEQTYKFAKDLNCEYSNFYCYVDYADKNRNPSEYAQYSPDFHPAGTDYLFPHEVVRFRDEAFMDYYTDSKYLKSIKDKFGIKAVADIKRLTKIRLVRNG